MSYSISLEEGKVAVSAARAPRLVLLEEVPGDIRRYITKSARLEPSVPDGHLYAYLADVEAATLAVHGDRR